MKGKQRNRVLLAALALLGALGVTLAPVQVWAGYPDRPVTVLVAFEAGGSLDILVRAMAPLVEKELGQPLVIENKAGGGGTLALSLLSAAKPDGYTICAGASTAIVRAPQLQKVPYKPLGSFTPVLAYGAVQNATVVQSGAPWKTLKDLVAYAMANPGKVKYSSVGAGSAQHHAMEVVSHAEGIKWVHIPYKGGAPALTAILGGHVDAASLGPIWVPQMKSGSLRALAVHQEMRSPSFPDVPTLKELGYDFANDTVYSIFAPAGTAPEVVKKIEAAFLKGMEAPEFKAASNEFDLIPLQIRSAEYDRSLKELWPKLGKSMKETGLIEKPATEPY